MPENARGKDTTFWLATSRANGEIEWTNVTEAAVGGPVEQAELITRSEVAFGELRLENEVAVMVVITADPEAHETIQGAARDGVVPVQEWMLPPGYFGGHSDVA